MMNVVIVGAGPVGLLQSLYLLKYKNEAEVGFVLSEMSTITIFERRSKQDLFGNNNNRSINLALSWRGMKTLEEVGLLEEVLKYCVPIRGRYIHPIAGKEYINLYSSQPNEVLFSIKRDKIQKILLKEFAKRSANNNNNNSSIRCAIKYRENLLKIDPDRMILDFSSAKGIRADLIFACDGASSKVRSEMLRKFTGKIEQETFTHQYQEFSIPAPLSTSASSSSVDSKISQEYLHIWPRKDFMLIALPNLDESFTATLFCDSRIWEKTEVTDFFKENFPDFYRMAGEERIREDFEKKKPSNLVSASIRPMTFERIVLLGDAAHTILPFYGQGMNFGFEDVQILTNLLRSCKSFSDLTENLIKFSSSRTEDAASIDEFARENYHEMRSNVLGFFFKIKYKLFLHLNRFFPHLIATRYSMITFTSIPYSSVKEKETLRAISVVIFLIYICLLVFISLKI